jgi:hypothetical protein
MGLKNALIHLLLAAPLGLAHPAGEKEPLHAAQPLYLRSLDHCQEHFDEPEFKKRIVDRHMAEFNHLRRKRGLEEVYGLPCSQKEPRFFPYDPANIISSQQHHSTPSDRCQGIVY